MIKQIRIPLYSKEWHDFRYANGFGGSDISWPVATKSETIARLSYTAPIKGYLQAIGEPVTPFTGNVSSEGGHYFEKIILHWYKHFDLDNPDMLQMFKNIKENRRINKVLSPKVFTINDKYPWLFYSMDAWAKKAYTGNRRLCECKTTTSMEAGRYKNKVSPLFYCQVQMGLMMTEYEVADLNILIDGKWLEVISVEPHRETWDLILETSQEQWQRVLKARQLKAEYGLTSYFGVNPDYFSDKQKEGVELLSQLEPELSGTDSELSFIKDMIKPSEEENPMEGTPEQRDLCVKYLAIGDKSEVLEIEKKKLYIELIQSLGGANKADFNDGTFFSYKNVKGSRTLYVSKKILSVTAL